MSDVTADPRVTVCAAEATGGPVSELVEPRRVRLGESTEVRRLLPSLGRRMVGAWCFVDHYGPDEIAAEPGMQVAPHPHIGLQTVSWLLSGEVHHRDSLGSSALVRPGELGLMTAGRGIAHSEQSPDPHSPLLHGAQLWVALPDEARDVAPRFEHHTDLPVVTAPGLRATVLLGDLGGAASPGRVHSPLLGAEVVLGSGAAGVLPLDPDFEYAVLTVEGAPRVAGREVGPGTLLYLGCGRRDLALEAGPASRFLLLGGVPFPEQLVMWWNFVGRSGTEVTEARETWQREVAEGRGDRFRGPARPRSAAAPGRWS
uniref:pirin family protein n=1 Tax=Pseudonocardia pini TaxID=2758030 RepID=UPI0015F0C204